MEDMEALGVRKNVDMYPRSHDYINEIAMQIQLLLDKGYAYLADGDVYYEVDKFKDYTKLSGMKLDELDKAQDRSGEGQEEAIRLRLMEGCKAWRTELEDKAEVQEARKPS